VEYGQMIGRMLRAFARRAGSDIGSLTALVELRAELERTITAAVTDLHDAGHSWTEIARELGITRQAARQRYTEGA
jgi:DNA invertase Pin-like site-specific DNA recombinase